MINTFLKVNGVGSSLWKYEIMFFQLAIYWSLLSRGVGKRVVKSLVIVADCEVILCLKLMWEFNLAFELVTYICWANCRGCCDQRTNWGYFCLLQMCVCFFANVRDTWMGMLHYIQKLGTGWLCMLFWYWASQLDFLTLLGVLALFFLETFLEGGVHKIFFLWCVSIQGGCTWRRGLLLLARWCHHCHFICPIRGWRAVHD